MNSVLDVNELALRGFVVVRAETVEGMTAVLQPLGNVIQRERVALREGAHAYLAKPGAVPLIPTIPRQRGSAGSARHRTNATGPICSLMLGQSSNACLRCAGKR